MSEEQSWAEYHAEIDRRLDELRPKRSTQRDRDWREPVVGWARNHIPDESNVIRHFAEKTVGTREGQATRRGNRLLRKWAKGQMPLLWSDLGPLPIIVDRVRIRMDAAVPDDFEDAARELRSTGKNTYDEILILADTMEDLARSARRSGHSFVAEIGDLDPRGEAQDDPDLDWGDDEDDSV